MTLNNLAKEIHENAKAKHWWDEPRSTGEIIALIHSELSEALEEARNNRTNAYLTDKHANNEKIFSLGGLPDLAKLVAREPHRFKPEGLPVELADALIRILDYAAYMGYDMDSIVKMKMRYNETRPAKHGKLF